MSATRKLLNVPINRNLHPNAYALLAATVLWITLVAWIFFGHDAYTALQLAVVMVFTIAFIVTPLALWHLSAARGGKRDEAGSLSDWLVGEFDICTGSVPGAHALVMVLLAPMACAVGFTIVSLIARLVAP
jgi:hypothetical protein